MQPGITCHNAIFILGEVAAARRSVEHEERCNAVGALYREESAAGSVVGPLPTTLDGSIDQWRVVGLDEPCKTPSVSPSRFVHRGGA